MEFKEYGRLGDGHRAVPDGAGGLAYVKLGNEKLRGIPAQDRLLEVVCSAGGSRRGGPRLVAVVTRDWGVYVIETPIADWAPGHVHAPCRCNPEGHSLSLALLTAAVQLLEHRPPKARRVDAQRVQRQVM